MDRFVARLPAVADGDLMLFEGGAYQADMERGRVPYDAGYLAKVDAYEGTPIAQAVNAGRCALLLRHLHEGASLLDFGAGSGAFVRCARSWGFDAKGFDVIPEAAARLREAGLHAGQTEVFEAVTMWDVLEHIDDPEAILNALRVGSKLFVSIPVFEDLSRVRESKHYRPGEHLYYWTPVAFLAWMRLRGFRLLESSQHEVNAGRESIGAFAFVRDVVPHHCPCGGSAYVDSFEWPKKPVQWFLRCDKCDRMSRAVATRPEAERLEMEQA